MQVSSSSSSSRTRLFSTSRIRTRPRVGRTISSHSRSTQPTRRPTRPHKLRRTSCRISMRPTPHQARAGRRSLRRRMATLTLHSSRRRATARRPLRRARRRHRLLQGRTTSTQPRKLARPVRTKRHLTGVLHRCTLSRLRPTHLTRLRREPTPLRSRRTPLRYRPIGTRSRTRRHRLMRRRRRTRVRRQGRRHRPHRRLSHRTSGPIAERARSRDTPPRSRPSSHPCPQPHPRHQSHPAQARPPRWLTATRRACRQSRPVRPGPTRCPSRR